MDVFCVWQRDIGVDYPDIMEYKFEAKFGPARSNEIEFAASKGRPKWERIEHLRETLPQEADIQMVHEIQSLEKQWISPKEPMQ